MTDLLVRLGDASILKNGGGILVMENGFEMREGGGLIPLYGLRCHHTEPRSIEHIRAQIHCLSPHYPAK